MTKKSDTELSLLVQPEGYQKLLEEAIFSIGPSKEQYIRPKWFEIKKIWRSRPCHAIGCGGFLDTSRHGDESGVWLFIQRIFFATILGSLAGSVLFGKDGHWLYSCLSLLIFIHSILFTRFCQRKLDWLVHEEVMNKEFKKRLEANPAETIVEYLTSRLFCAKFKILGIDAPLMMIRHRLHERSGEVSEISLKLKHRAEERIGAYKEALLEAKKRLDDLHVRLKQKEEELDAHIASVRAFFAECEERIKALKQPVDDLPLLQRAADLEAEAEQNMAQVEGIIFDSILQMQEQIVEWHDRIAATMTEPSKVLFVSSDGADLEADLERYEKAAAAAFPSKLSPAEIKS